MVQKRSKFNRYLKQVIFSVFGFLAASEAAFSDEIKVNIFVPVETASYSYEYAEDISYPLLRNQIEIIKQAVIDCGRRCQNIDEIEIRYIPHSLGSLRGQRVWPIPGAVQPTPWIDLEKKEDGKIRLHFLVSDFRLLVDLWIIDTRPLSSELPLESFSVSEECFGTLMANVYEYETTHESEDFSTENIPDCIPDVFFDPLLSFYNLEYLKGDGDKPRGEQYAGHWLEYSRMLNDRASDISEFYQNLLPVFLKSMLDETGYAWHHGFRGKRVTDSNRSPYWSTF